MGDTGVFCGIGSCVGDGEAPSCLNHESDVHVAPPDDDDLEGDILFQEGDLAGAALAYTELVAHYGTEDAPYPPAATKALPAKSWLRLGLSLPDRASADPTYRYAPVDEVACYKNCLARAKNWQKKLQADAHYHLALALEETKETEQSEAEYRKALRLDPTLASASNNLGLVLQRKSDVAGAERAFRDALATSPTHANARYNLAMLLWHERRDLPHAVLELREVVKLDTSHSIARAFVGSTLIGSRVKVVGQTAGAVVRGFDLTALPESAAAPCELSIEIEGSGAEQKIDASKLSLDLDGLGPAPAVKPPPAPAPEPERHSIPPRRAYGEAGDELVWAPPPKQALKENKVTHTGDAPVTVFAPPGKLGLLFEQKDDHGHHRIAGLSVGSPLAGRIAGGDRIMKVDDVDTSNMGHDAVVDLMKSKADQKERVMLVAAGEWRLRDVHVPAGSLGLAFCADGAFRGVAARVGQVLDDSPLKGIVGVDDMVVALDGAPTAQLGPKEMEAAINASLHNDKRVLTVRSGPAPGGRKAGMRFVTLPAGKHGIVLKPSSDGTAFVESVSPESPIATKLWPNDLIIAVNDANTSRLGVAALQGLLDAAAGGERQLIVRARGAAKGETGAVHALRQFVAPAGKLMVLFTDASDGRAHVHDVSPGSPCTGHLAQGDVIVKVDQTDTAHLSRDELVQLLVSRQGKRRVLIIRAAPLRERAAEGAPTSPASPAAAAPAPAPKAAASKKPEPGPERTITAPPGPLGLNLNNGRDGVARVHSLSERSPLAGQIQENDVIVKVGSVNTSKFSKDKLTAAKGPIASKAAEERVLVVRNMPEA